MGIANNKVQPVARWVLGSVAALVGGGACAASTAAPSASPVSSAPAPAITSAKAADTLAGAVYKDPKAPLETRVSDLLGRMTPQEKAQMLAGSGWMESAAIPRLGIPAIKMVDGPMGIRNWIGTSAATNATPIQATAFPSGVSMASSWDPALVRAQGQAVAQEVKALGRDMILGPTVNINRTPLWGRNFEGYGEDPFLAARLGVAYVQGVQGEGVIATVKHFAANNQEFERHRIDEKIDLRALHEIYFPAFKAAVQEAGVWSVMSAYNKVNGQSCAENRFLLAEILEKDWGFKGFVVSDWGSTYSTAETIHGGMDLEMPGGEPMRKWAAKPEFTEQGRGAGWLAEDKVLAALAAQKVSQTDIDDNVARILRVTFSAGLFEAQHAGGGEIDTAEQRAVARKAATESLVLLKNERGLLPLAAGKPRSIAVIGPNAAVARPGGGGSSRVTSKYTVSPLDGIREAAGPQTPVNYALGVPMECEGALSPTDRAAAVALAAKSDVAIVVVGNAAALESEGFDRKSMDLPAGQDDLIEAVAKVNKKTIVVVAAGAPVTMTRWVGKVSAVLYAWYGGQEVGHAVGDVLFGLVNPSGKTPVTFPKQIQDSTAYGNYPGENLKVAYAEGIYVGYRGFEQRKVEPLFPFGFGLSYTTFEYSDLRVSRPTASGSEIQEASLSVRNSGKRPGTEIVQLYLHDAESTVDRPVKELKGFERITLEPGETKTVTFRLDRAALSFWSPKQQSWVAEPGQFEVLVGSSSRDIRLKASFQLAQ